MRQWSASVGAIHQSPVFVNGGFLVSACRYQTQNCALFQLDLATGERLWEVGTDGFGVPHNMAVTNGAIYGATTWSRIDRLLFYRVSGSDIFALALPPHPTT
jgi:hypothetical protein